MNGHTLMAIAWLLIAVNFALIGINGVVLRKAKRMNRELLEALTLWKTRTDAARRSDAAGTGEV